MRKESDTGWSFLTNHGHVLLCIASERDIRVRDIAQRSGITERAAQRIISDLERSGFVSHRRVGRRNRYEISRGMRFLHPLENHLDTHAIAPPEGDDARIR